MMLVTGATGNAGRELTFAEIAPERVRRGMLAAGPPAEIPDRLLGSLADYARAPGTVLDDRGRPARPAGRRESRPGSAQRG